MNYAHVRNEAIVEAGAFITGGLTADAGMTTVGADDTHVFGAAASAGAGGGDVGIAGSVAPDRPWEEQVDAALAAYLDTVTARPALWQSFVRELPALGQAGAARQRAVIERFVA